MDMEDVVLVATVREEIRTRGPFVDTTIKDRIQAAQDRMVAHLANDDDDFADDSESEADERVSLKGAVTGIGAKADSYNGTKNIAEAIPHKVVDVHGSGEHSTEVVGDSSAELPAGRNRTKVSKAKPNRKNGGKAGANMPQSTPIASESEENYVSNAIPKEDGEKRPPPNPGSWFSKISAANSAMGMFPEGSSNVPVKKSQRSPAIEPSSPSFRR